MNEVIKNIKDRRSIRKYSSTPVSKEDLETIVDAGLYAPNGRGLQATKIVIVQDPETIAALSQLNRSFLPSEIDTFYGATALAIVFGEKERVTCVQDGSAVITAMALAAHSIGVGSCWVHRAKEVFETDEGKKLMDQWGVPSDYVGVGNLTLGYPTQPNPDCKPRDLERVIWA